MRKTLFAGLTVLELDESLLSDDGAFMSRDRDAIDRLLEVGAKTHRHNALLGLPNPDRTPSGSVVASGGQLPADAAFAIGYTLEDDSNGETMLSPTILVSTPAPIDPPSDVLTLVMDYTAGDLLADTYYYAKSWVDGEGGETPIGPAGVIEREPGFPLGRVLISGLNTGMATASAAGWRLYRTVGGGDFHYLASGTGSSYVDEGALCLNDITPLPDDVNTTNGDNSLLVRIPAGGTNGSATTINIYASEDGDFAGDVLLDSWPVASAGQQAVYRTFDLGDQQPPDVNLSIGGASKIDPDTDILDWHWLRPVAGSAALPSGQLADVRLDETTGRIYGMLKSPSGALATDWTILGSGGVGSIRQVAASGDGVANNPTAILLASAASGEPSVTSFGGSAIVLIPDQHIGRVAASASSTGPASALTFLGGAPQPSATVQGVGREARVTLPWQMQHVQAEGGAAGDAAWPTALLVSASGVAQVAVDQAGGSAHVTIFASATQGEKGDTGDQGPVGPGGDGIAKVRASGEADTTFNAPSGIVVQASGALSAHADDLGGGSARVLIAPRGRMWASAMVAGLASGASVSLLFAPSAAGGRLIELSTNKRSRVRVYGASANEVADRARAIGTLPTGDHGVLLDHAMTAQPSGAIGKLSPTVDAHNLDEPQVNRFYLNVTNYDNTGDVIVAFLYIPTEIV